MTLSEKHVQILHTLCGVFLGVFPPIEALVAFVSSSDYSKTRISSLA